MMAQRFSRVFGRGHRSEGPSACEEASRGHLPRRGFCFYPDASPDSSCSSRRTAMKDNAVYVLKEAAPDTIMWQKINWRH